MLYPITFNYLGRQGGIFVLFVDSDKARQEWRAKLEETQNLRRIDLEETRIFETVTMSAETFAARTSRISDQSRRDGSLVPIGRPTCSAFFSTLYHMQSFSVDCAAVQLHQKVILWSPLVTMTGFGSDCDTILLPIGWFYISNTLRNVLSFKTLAYS